MGFALPTLSSLSFLRLAQGIRLPAAAMEPAMRTIQPESPVQSEQATILSFSKARRRSQQRRSKSARLPEHRDAQLLLPLQPELPSLPADQALPWVCASSSARRRSSPNACSSRAAWPMSVPPWNAWKRTARRHRPEVALRPTRPPGLREPGPVSCLAQRQGLRIRP